MPSEKEIQKKINEEKRAKKEGVAPAEKTVKKPATKVKKEGSTDKKKDDES